MPVMSANHRYCVQTALIVVACAVLGGCGTRMSSSTINPVNWVTPYKMDVIQGNFVSKEQVAQLRVGMSRDEVKAALAGNMCRCTGYERIIDAVMSLSDVAVGSAGEEAR